MSAILTRAPSRPIPLPGWWKSWPGASVWPWLPTPGGSGTGVDTVVDVNGEVFGKPHSVEDAKRMLRALSGATHQVHTGVCVSDGAQTKSFVDSCRVTFFPISEEEIERYTATKEPYDKAGAYAIQGRAALWLDRIEGDYYTIMGLPVSRTVRLIEQF